MVPSVNAAAGFLFVNRTTKTIHLRELEIFALFIRVFLLLANTMVPIFNSEIRLILFQIFFSLPCM